MLGDSWVLLTLRHADRCQYSLQGEVYLDSLYEGSSANPHIRGTGTNYPRGIMGINIAAEAIKEKEQAPSPFFELYNLNPSEIRTVQLI
jgi:hypothetical protein